VVRRKKRVFENRGDVHLSPPASLRLLRPPQKVSPCEMEGVPQKACSWETKLSSPENLRRRWGPNLPPKAQELVPPNEGRPFVPQPFPGPITPCCCEKWAKPEAQLCQMCPFSLEKEIGALPTFRRKLLSPPEKEGAPPQSPPKGGLKKCPKPLNLEMKFPVGCLRTCLDLGNLTLRPQEFEANCLSCAAPKFPVLL